MNLLVLFARFKDWVALILALLISLVLMNSSSHPSAEKFRFGMGRFISFISAPVMIIPRTIEVWGENAELRAEVVRFSTERSQWRDAVLENIRLRKMLGFRERTDFTYLASDVIARNPSFSMSSMLLDKGKRDSVKIGHAVITAEGLLGVIHHVNNSTSVSQLATDPNFAVSVKIERSRLDGILRWYQGETLLVDGITKNQDLKDGDRIITSGLGGLIPGGIPVGIVTQVEKEKSDIFLKVRVKPFVHFSRIEEVFILLPPVSSEEEVEG